MNWSEMRSCYYWLPESSDGWHQHANGGGWVQDDCKIDSDAYISSDSYVADGSRVTGGSVVTGRSVVEGGSVVTGRSVVTGYSVVTGRSVVTGYSVVTGRSVVEGGSRVDTEAKLHGGIHIRSPIWIRGSHYSIGYSRHGYIASGCIEKPLTWWLENVERCAEEHDYTPDEQKEYRMHVEHIAAWMKLYGVDQPEKTTKDTETK